MLGLKFNGWLLLVLSGLPLLGVGAEQVQTWAVAQSETSAEVLEVETTCFMPDKSSIQRSVLWLPSEHGYPEGVKVEAERLAHVSGSRVCLADLFEAYFLSVAPSSVSQIPSGVVWALVQKLQQQAPNKPLYLLAEDKGAALAVRGWHWAQQQGAIQNKGLILLNPNLYTETPIPGETARFLPEVTQVNAPLFIFQAELSPWRWRLVDLADKLAEGGSEVWLQLLPKVRDRFYFRPDAMPYEQQQAKLLPEKLVLAMQALKPDLAKPRTLKKGKKLAKISSPAPLKLAKKGKKAGLVPYSGPQNLPLQLQSLQGKQVDLASFKGKVVLLNFWASWCPPCVHEIPSMVALKSQLKGQPFEILAANLAEEKPVIEAFLQQHPVNFPVLLDPEGSAVKTWQVFAYPSSYLIDKKGRIRYALFGGYDWTQPEVMAVIRQLMAEE